MNSIGRNGTEVKRNGEESFGMDQTAPQTLADAAYALADELDWLAHRDTLPALINDGADMLRVLANLMRATRNYGQLPDYATQANA